MQPVAKENLSQEEYNQNVNNSCLVFNIYLPSFIMFETMQYQGNIF